MGRAFGWLVSPCMDICDYSQNQAGHCRGCGMTEQEKKAFKRAPQQTQAAFIGELLSRFSEAAPRTAFITAYRSKCGRSNTHVSSLSIEALEAALAAQSHES